MTASFLRARRSPEEDCVLSSSPGPSFPGGRHRPPGDALKPEAMAHLMEGTWVSRKLCGDRPAPH